MGYGSLHQQLFFERASGKKDTDLLPVWEKIVLRADYRKCCLDGHGMCGFPLQVMEVSDFGER